MQLTPAERLASFLIAPHEAARPAPDALPSPEEFQGLVEDHHLPLDEVIAVNRLESDLLVAAPAVQAALKEDRERHIAVRDEFAAFRERLDAAGIPHVLIKGAHGVPYRSDNIDILFLPKDYEAAGKVARGLGYIENLLRPNDYKSLFIRIAGSRRTGILHFHRAVSWYSPFIEPDGMFETAVDGAEAGARIPRAELAMATIGCHAMYEDACVRMIELHKIRCLLARGPVDWNYLWQAARHRGFASGLALFFLILDRQHRGVVGRPMFDEPTLSTMQSHLGSLDGTRQHYRRHIADHDVPSLYAVSKYFARRCLFVQLKRCGIIPAATKLRVAETILRFGFRQVTRWEPQRSHLVAVCGPDGCGKSAVIERLVAGLWCFEVYTRPSWRRLGDSPVLNLLKCPFRGRVRAEARTGHASEQGEFRSAALRKLWPLLAVPDYLLRQYAGIAWAFLRQKMVIADRYHVDALVDLATRCGPQVLEKRWILWAMRRLPQARPAVVLECSPETLRRRRAEDYISGITERTAGYYQKAARLLGAEIVSNEGELEPLAEKMTLEVLSQFFGRL
jgi:hypothetical protein